MAASMYSIKCQRLLANYDLVLRHIYLNKNHILCASCFSTSRNVSESYIDDVDEEHDRLRDVSGLRGNLHKRINDEMPDILNKYQESLRYQRRRYAKFGSTSDIDPRIMWPSKSQLADIIEDEKVWEPTLQRTLEIVRSKQLKEEQKQRLREEKVEQNMLKMSKWIEEYHQRKQQQVEEQKKREEKKAKMLDDAQEYFGYRIDPRDRKFKEMLELKELEEKKLAKKKKKQSKLEKLTSRLEAMAQES